MDGINGVNLQNEANSEYWIRAVVIESCKAESPVVICLLYSATSLHHHHLSRLITALGDILLLVS